MILLLLRYHSIVFKKNIIFVFLPTFYRYGRTYEEAGEDWRGTYC